MNSLSSMAVSEGNYSTQNDGLELPSASSTCHVFQNGSDPCAHVVHVLLCYHQGGEDPDFIRKAIESLVKKLKDRRTQLDALISAVTSGGKQSTGCVTIHRSLDGRLQVAGRKGVPHVVYARIWRWPNVNKNELQKLPICTTSNDHPDFICINPFHYDRIVSSGLSNIEMSSLRLDPLRWLGEEDRDSQMLSCSNENIGANVNMDQTSSKRSIREFKDVIQAGTSCDTDIDNKDITDNKQPLLIFGPNQQPACVVSHLASGSTISNWQSPVSLFFQNQEKSQSNMNAVGTSSVQKEIPSNFDKYLIDANIQRNDFGKSLQTATSSTINDNLFSKQTFNDKNNKVEENMLLVAKNDSKSMQYQDNICDQRYNNSRYNIRQVQIPIIDAPEHWCTILYYELDTSVGEAYKVSRDLHEISVDGGMNPSGGRNGRFCLGALSNVHRTQMSEKARLHIGKGIKLTTTDNGSVYLKCLSRKGVFVRSYFLDYEHGLIYGSTVHKFCSGAEKKIFDLQWAFAEMCEQRESAQMAVIAQAYAVAGIVPRVAPSLIERAGIGVDDLRRVCCTIAISFVKGWGSGYNRSSIKETPCWIEVHLHRPLQLLNYLLQKTD